jgi:hypothetical protein
MSGKENTNDDAFVAFVQLRGLQRFTGQHGWVQMQASSKDNFDKLLGPRCHSRHVGIHKGFRRSFPVTFCSESRRNGMATIDVLVLI